MIDHGIYRPQSLFCVVHAKRVSHNRVSHIALVRERLYPTAKIRVSISIRVRVRVRERLYPTAKERQHAPGRIPGG